MSATYIGHVTSSTFGGISAGDGVSGAYDIAFPGFANNQSSSAGYWNVSIDGCNFAIRPNNSAHCTSTTQQIQVDSETSLVSAPIDPNDPRHNGGGYVGNGYEYYDCSLGIADVNADGSHLRFQSGNATITDTVINVTGATPAFAPYVGYNIAFEIDAANLPEPAVGLPIICGAAGLLLRRARRGCP
jgi:hypothetical protein